jgi:DNA-binding NarL/FixJ family response regulator
MQEEVIVMSLNFLKTPIDLIGAPFTPLDRDVEDDGNFEDGPGEGGALESAQINETKRPTVRIMIADDHPIVRQALKRLLTLEEDFNIVGEAADGREVLERVRTVDPDVLLLDLRMPNLDGLATLQALRKTNPRTRVIILTASENKSDFVQAMKLGCCGILLKETAPDLIAKCIRKVGEGEIWLDSQTMAAVMRQFSTRVEGSVKRGGGKGRQQGPLSARESEIVELAAQGYKNREIAQKMFISEQTVKNHLHNIFEKLGVSGRKELKTYSTQKGLHSTARSH